VLWQELNVGRSKVLIAIEIGESPYCHRPGYGKVLGLRVQGQSGGCAFERNNKSNTSM
jgi:hypothetical protein